jgi:predicted membrane GTPase involved in stress response
VFLQVDQAVAGDVVSLCGVPASITDTIAAPEVIAALDPGHVEPPTLRWVCGCMNGGRGQMRGRWVVEFRPWRYVGLRNDLQHWHVCDDILC